MRAVVAVSVNVGYSKNRGRIPGAGSSTPPPSGSAVPFAPVINNAIANGSGSVTVRWFDLPAGTYTSLDIYYSTSPNAGLSGTKVNVPSLSATSHTFTVPTGTQYFWMSLSNSVGESDPSARRTLVVT
jgi:hypothetical protein